MLLLQGFGKRDCERILSQAFESTLSADRLPATEPANDLILSLSRLFLVHQEQTG
jgi:hypothetical protein